MIPSLYHQYRIPEHQHRNRLCTSSIPLTVPFLYRPVCIQPQNGTWSVLFRYRILSCRYIYWAGLYWQPLQATGTIPLQKLYRHVYWDVTQGLYSLSGKTSYRQISRSLEAARLGVIMIVSFWNLTGISAALLPRWLSNFRAIGKVLTRISRFRDFTRSCGKTSYRLVNRGPGVS